MKRFVLSVVLAGMMVLSVQAFAQSTVKKRAMATDPGGSPCACLCVPIWDGKVICLCVC